MRSAARLFALHVSLAGVGLGTLGAALIVGLGHLSTSTPSLAAVATACQRWLPALSPGAWLLLALLALSAVCAVRGLRSILVDVAASRSYLRSLPLAGPSRVANARFQLVDHAQPLAFCAGFLRPRIYVSRGAIELLDGEELRAVVAHEGHHCRRRDPLRILTGRALAAALFFLPVLRSSSERLPVLGELAADEAAVRHVGGRGPLASALVTFSDAAPTPARGLGDDRVDHLAGESSSTAWRISPAALGASLAALGALAATALVLGRLSPATEFELPLVLAQSCMLLMTAGPALFAGWLVWRLRRRFIAV